VPNCLDLRGALQFLDRDDATSANETFNEAMAVPMPPPPRTGGPPVTNIRNTSSPHWRGWLKPENRCLVPFNSFAEYAPEPNPETKKKDVVWFAIGR
jgi:putative SOS response-associated peptidase YedK